MLSEGVREYAPGKILHSHYHYTNKQYLHTTSQELNIYPLFFFTNGGYNNIKRFNISSFSFSSPLFLLQKPRLVTAVFAFFSE